MEHHDSVARAWTPCVAKHPNAQLCSSARRLQGIFAVKPAMHCTALHCTSRPVHSPNARVRASSRFCANRGASFIQTLPPRSRKNQSTSPLNPPKASHTFAAMPASLMYVSQSQHAHQHTVASCESLTVALLIYPPFGLELAATICASARPANTSNEHAGATSC